MSEILEYHTSSNDPTSRRLETFSYLPEMDAARIRQQVEYIVTQGWKPAIEHIEAAGAPQNYWHLWKLPLFGEVDVDRIIAECKACHEAHPDDHVRLLGLDPVAQSAGAAMVIYRGRTHPAPN